MTIEPALWLPAVARYLGGTGDEQSHVQQDSSNEIQEKHDRRHRVTRLEWGYREGSLLVSSAHCSSLEEPGIPYPSRQLPHMSQHTSSNAHPRKHSVNHGFRARAGRTLQSHTSGWSTSQQQQQQCRRNTHLYLCETCQTAATGWRHDRPLGSTAHRRLVAPSTGIYLFLIIALLFSSARAVSI